MAPTFLRQLLVKSMGAVLPVILPPLHILVLYHFWREYGRRVNRQYCSCSCWDTIFKGTYESGIASYKHLYFNATSNTTKIWVSTVLCILLLYECCKQMVSLIFEGRARYLMCVLFLSSLFAHYYTWWVYVNYWNDEFYSQWNHQLFFTVTELLSTIFVLHLADSSNALTSRKVAIIVSIAIVHILAGGLDQFLANVVFGEGFAHQVLRDLCFMIPDVLHVLLPALELLRGRRKRTGSGAGGWCDAKGDFPLMMALITGGCALSYIL